MLKRFDGTIQGKDVQITKLSAEPALKVHAELTNILSNSMPELMDGAGKDDKEQLESFGRAVQSAFQGVGADKFVSFIKQALITGNVIVDGQRVSHLDDLDRWDDIDGSILMYEIFTEWLKLNFGNLLKKVSGLIG